MKSEKENPPRAPLTEAVEATAQHQAAGFSPSTTPNRTDSFAKVNPDSEKKNGKSFVRPVRDHAQGEYEAVYTNVVDEKKYINNKGTHVETVANSAEQSFDRPGAIPEQSNGDA